MPPFTHETAEQKIRGAENGWNSCNLKLVSMVYTPDSYWRNRSDFIRGREEIVGFLTRKWAKELDYRLIKEFWAFTANRIAVRFAYEWHDDAGNWFRSYGNENWEFADNGLMQRRSASINDLPIGGQSASIIGIGPGTVLPSIPGFLIWGFDNRENPRQRSGLAARATAVAK